jgi:phosphate-selective porin
VYAAGIFNGTGRNTTDVNDDKQFAARVIFQPFQGSSQFLFEGLHVGGAATIQRQFRDINKAFLTQSGFPFLEFVPGVKQHGQTMRYNAQLEWLIDSLKIMSEWIAVERQSVKNRQETLSKILKFNSWYVSASYLLTGEMQVKNQPLSPTKPLGKGGLGALELALRGESFYANHEALTSGLMSGARRVVAGTGALNWIANKHIRLMFNYTYNSFSPKVDQFDHENIFIARGQFCF